MQVQAIQPTNNCQKPSFKAHFINDAQGNFKLLWQNAQKDSALMQKIENFASKHRNHALEIISLEIIRQNSGYSYVGSGAEIGAYYKILNHYTGKISEYFSASNICHKLSIILDFLENDEQIFENDAAAKSYRLLTGQEKPPTITI